jgi:phytoene synthase
MRHHSKTFSLAQRLLPKRCREPAAILYAWCRRADDAVDELPEAEARPALVRLERELTEIYAGVPQTDPLLEAFRQVIEESGIPEAYPRELLAGMRMDVEKAQYASLSDLHLYCYRVAGTVGLMMCHLMGVRQPSALRHAAHLGMAMQLTNICRDVVEDWNRGRLYLPGELLRERRPEGAFPVTERRPFAQAVEALLHEADRLYVSGDQGLRFLSLGSMWAVLVARLVYSRIGQVLRARDCDVTLGRARVPLATKLWLVVRGLGYVLSDLPRRLAARQNESASLHAVRYPDVFPL